MPDACLIMKKSKQTISQSITTQKLRAKYHNRNKGKKCRNQLNKLSRITINWYHTTEMQLNYKKAYRPS